MLAWFGALAHGILAMGYIGVYISMVIEGMGLPFPGDMVLAFYGFASARGDLNPGLIFVIGVAGYLTGAMLVYVVCRTYGPIWLNRSRAVAMLSDRSMMRTTRLIDRYGPWLLVPGRFLPGVRSVSSYVAGVSRMDVKPFVIYTGIGVVLWCAAWIAVGFWFGDHLRAVVRFIQSSLAYFTVALVIVVLIGWWLQKTQRTR